MRLVQIAGALFFAFATQPLVLGQSTVALHMTIVPNQAALNEVATIMRTVGDIRQLSTNHSTNDIIVSGSEADTAFAAWLVKQLDNTEPQSSGPYSMPNGSVAQILYLKHTGGQNAVLNEVVTTLRAVADVQRIFTYTPLQAIVLRASPTRLQAAEWLAAQVDVTTTDDARFQPHEYLLQDSAGQVLRVLYAVHPTSLAGLNEMITTLRTVADIQAIFSRSTPPGIAFRTSPAKAQMADWLFQQLDVTPTDDARFQPHEYPLQDGSSQVLRVLYAVHRMSPAGLNEMATTLRTVGDIQAIFIRSTPPGIAFRTSPAKARLADWLFQQLDVQPDDQMRAQLHEYRLKGDPDEVARVYYLKSGDSQQQISEIATAVRSVANVSRIFTCVNTNALALRGTADMIDTADRIIKQEDR